MKKLIYILLCLGLLCIGGVANVGFGQVLYDEGPILSGSDHEFTVHGNSWSSDHLTYFFQNGTGDIAGTAEQDAMRMAFSFWTCVSPLTFSRASSADAADIVILWGIDDHGDGDPFDGTNGVLAHAFFPPPNGGAIAGDIHFDDDERWTLAVRLGWAQPIDLMTVAAHEIGHSLGLRHSDVSTALMNAFYSGSHRFLDADDIAGIRDIYGSEVSRLTLSHTAHAGTTEARLAREIVSTGTISSDATVLYEAHEATLSTGFHALPGSNFTARSFPSCNGVAATRSKSRVTDAPQPVHESTPIAGTAQRSLLSPEFNIYPNPNDGRFTIDVKMHGGEVYTLQIVNTIGKSVYQEDQLQEASVVVEESELVPGVYYVKIGNDKGETTKKMVIR